jgi:CheY-like chemotaxis protein
MDGAQSHILLVDDEEGFRYAATKALRVAGFDVVSVPDYRGALQTLEGEQPLDLLVTDIVMPDRVNGFALARMARMRRLDLKVLYLTAYDVPSHEAIGKILRKPITPDELTAEVRLALTS